MNLSTIEYYKYRKLTQIIVLVAIYGWYIGVCPTHSQENSKVTSSSIARKRHQTYTQYDHERLYDDSRTAHLKMVVQVPSSKHPERCTDIRRYVQKVCHLYGVTHRPV